jgi:uncharacterized protein (TIGR02246 family)
MILRSILLALCFITTSAFSQSNEPVAVVQKQLDTYNAQDLSGFVSLFAEDAQIFMTIGDTAASMTGRDEIRKRYGAMFEKNPNNRSTLVGRMVQGNFVFDHEWITGREQEVKIVAIYEVVDGLIQRCWFVR